MTEAPALDALGSVTEVQVRFADLDAMGHVNNAVYLTYLELGRLDWFGRLTAAAGVDMGLDGAIVARIEIDYRRPVRLGSGPVTVEVGLRSVGRSSFLLGYALHQAGAVVALATSVVVAYDYASGASRPLEGPFAEALRALVPGSPGST